MEYKDLSGCSINESISIYNCDCMDLLKQTPDNYYSLAIVDPPYGMVGNVFQMKSKNLLKDGQTSARLDDKNSSIEFNLKEPPGKEYFDELFRVSKNQIIFGMQYFTPFLPKTQCVIVWDKVNGGSYFSDAEIAWTSFKSAVRIAKIHNPSGNRIHPTQKPVKLYEWILSRYAEPNQKILDTHLGSGSIAIAIDNVNKIEKMNLTLTACELDTDYFKAAIKRIEQQTAQQTIF